MFLPLEQNRVIEQAKFTYFSPTKNFKIKSKQLENKEKRNQIFKTF